MAGMRCIARMYTVERISRRPCKNMQAFTQRLYTSRSIYYITQPSRNRAWHPGAQSQRVGRCGVRPGARYRIPWRGRCIAHRTYSCVRVQATRQRLRTNPHAHGSRPPACVVRAAPGRRRSRAVRSGVIAGEVRGMSQDRGYCQLSSLLSSRKARSSKSHTKMSPTSSLKSSSRLAHTWLVVQISA